MADDKRGRVLFHMLEVYVCNAGKGDCIRIRFGGIHNIFIDTGVSRFGGSFKNICSGITAAGESLDVLILTHADNDHIGGLLANLRCNVPCPFREVWMNHEGAAYAGDAVLSARENNEVYARLLRQGVTVREMMRGTKRTVAGAVITAQNPGTEEMSACASSFHDTPLARHSDYHIPLSALAEAAMTKHDTSVSNRKSIVFTFEYENRRILFTGDAWAEAVVRASGDFDLIKLSHHGSVRNLSEAYRNRLFSRNFLICTDGIAHPDKQTIAKLERWYGEINLYSPAAWWSRGYFTQDDREHSIHYFQREGPVVAW